MRKNTLTLAASAAVAMFTLSSCITVNSGAAISSNSHIGTKVGEAQSGIILGLWSTKGQQNNIREAARQGGITTVTHVEYIDQSVLGGLYIKHTTRVYGQ